MPSASPSTSVTVADARAGFRRPLAVGVGTATIVGLALWKAPVVGVALAVGFAALSWRLRGSRLSPWRTSSTAPVPITVSPGQWSFARNLVWRWDDACVNAGLGEFVDDRYTYAGLTLVAIGEKDGVVTLTARLTPKQTAATVTAAESRLAAGLEVASALVAPSGGDEVTIAVTPVPTAGEWA